jgi:hypothetical protein
MMVTLILLGAAAALEFFVHIGLGWRVRKVVAPLALLANAASAGALIMWRPNVFSALIALLCLYRAFNMLRIVEQRMHERYLRHATLRSTVVLSALQLAVAGAWGLWTAFTVTGHGVWLAITALQLGVAAFLLWSVGRTMARTQWPAEHAAYTDSQLPTVTIAIPARNETEDLQQCLQSIIANDYPKLEVIVLDDCSQLRRTPEIIRDFAHDGVRFVQGLEPSDTWLPKNHAYARLTEEASGSLLIFCGVDVRFGPRTIRHIVGVMQDREKQMLSILPRREHDAYGHLSLLQAMRYWWELVPPRRLVNRPPVLSSCWAITAKALTEAGGFAAVARAIVPEAYFARELTKTDGYSFLRATPDMGLSSSKTVQDQRQTAVRTRYPQAHRRPEQVVLLCLLELVFLLAPFVVAVAGFWISVGWLAQVLAAAATVLLTATYYQVVLATHVNNRWFALIGHPLMVLSDIALLHYSMYKYELSEVDWKGRNVCVPAMYVVPHLPKLK